MKKSNKPTVFDRVKTSFGKIKQKVSDNISDSDVEATDAFLAMTPLGLPGKIPKAGKAIQKIGKSVKTEEVLNALRAIFAINPMGKGPVSKEAAKFLDGNKSKLSPVMKKVLGKSSYKIKGYIKQSKPK